MANNLRDLTLDHHQSVERTNFVQILLSGSIEPSLYHKYLTCQLKCYEALENAVELPDEYKVVFRSDRIRQDIKELEDTYSLEPYTKEFTSIERYIKHIEIQKLHKNNKALLAHLYVRHFGDMSGGQIIKTKVPGSGTMYDFDDITTLKENIRSMLRDRMAPDAKVCFEFAEMFFNELYEEECV